MALRTPFRNNVRLVFAVVLVAALVLAGLDAFLRESHDFAPDFLASVLLFGIAILDLSILLVLLLVLGRNIVRALMERRRGVLGARFRLRLLMVFALLAITPAVLMLLVGGDLIRHTVDRWFNVDVERMLSSSQALGTALRQVAAGQARTQARLLAREVASRRLLEAEGLSRLHFVVERRARELDMDLVSVSGREGELVAVVSPRFADYRLDRGSSARLVSEALAGRESEARVPFGAGELEQVAVPVQEGTSPPIGAVIVSTFLPGDVAGNLREVEERYVKFQKTRGYKEPIKALYVAVYLLPALLVLFAAVWLSQYLATRITTPLRLVADGAERIAAGERGVRADFPAGADEFGALIASFNRMSERLARSEEELDESRAGLARKNHELEVRQGLMETVLETVGVGVLVVDGSGTLSAVNAAGQRLLGIGSDGAGRALARVACDGGRELVAEMVARVLSGRSSRQGREVVVSGPEGDHHLNVTTVALPGSGGDAPGAVVVADDLTPLIQAQRVAAWGEVARKLAHEVKNPLTPIQLSAQRVRKAYLRNDAGFDRILTEATRSIVDEVESLKHLVDEFAHFARLPTAQLVPCQLREIIEQTLALYDGPFPEVRFERAVDPDLPQARVDPSQMKRLLINLLDNAIEAMERHGTISIEATFDREAGRFRLAVADDGPGISPAQRESLFVPHFSTKKHGGGLGLAMVGRIAQEHRGTVRFEENHPQGARFVVELPG